MIVMPREIHHENVKAGEWFIRNIHTHTHTLHTATSQILSNVPPKALIRSKDLMGSGFPWWLQVYFFVLLWNNLLGFPWGIIDLFDLTWDQDKFSFSIQIKPEDLERAICYLDSLMKKKVFFFFFQTRLKWASLLDAFTLRQPWAH